MAEKNNAAVPDNIRRRDFEITTYFIESEVKAIERVAKKSWISKSDVIRQAVRLALELGPENKKVRHRRPLYNGN